MKRIWKTLSQKRELPKNVPHLMAALVVLWLGHNALVCYSAAHWKMLHATSRMQSAVPSALALVLAHNTTLEPNDRAVFEGTLSDSRADLDALSDARRTIMDYSASYHFSGLLAVLFWVWGFRVGPKQLALLFVPVPMYGVFLAGCIM